MATISNIFIDQGANFSTTVTIKDSEDAALNLTGYTAIAQLRKSHLSSSATSFSGGTKTRVVEGTATVNPSVSRS